MIRPIVLLLLLVSLPLAAQQVEVRGARIWSAPDQTRLVVDATQPVQHKIFSLDDPDRLVIDIEQARLKGALPEVKDDDQFVAGVRSGVRGGSDLRIVLDLKRGVRAKSFLLPPNDRYKHHRLVVDLQNKPGAAPASAPALSKREAPPPKHLSVRKKSAKLRDVVVAVDAGHGGEDPGATGRGGTKEKNVTLAIARRLAKEIDRVPGMRAVLIRDGDYYVGLRQRIAKARKHKADLFVSIHADAFKDPSVRGSSVYTLSHRGASSEAAKWLAKRENSADLIGGIDLAEKNDVLATVLLDMSQNVTMEHSTIAAGKVLSKLKRIGAVHSSKVQNAGFVVLKSPDIPSMLVETAFISNPAEEKRLKSPSHQKAVAKAILGGVKGYFEDYAAPGTRLARAQAPGARKYVISRGDTLSEIARQYDVSLISLKTENGLRNDQVRVGQVLQIPGG